MQNANNFFENIKRSVVGHYVYLAICCQPDVNTMYYIRSYFFSFQIPGEWSSCSINCGGIGNETRYRNCTTATLDENDPLPGSIRVDDSLCNFTTLEEHRDCDRPSNCIEGDLTDFLLIINWDAFLHGCHFSALEWS